MKQTRNSRKMITLLAVMSICLVSHSQITVTSNGNAGVGTGNPLSKLSINSDGNSLHGVHVANLNPVNEAVGLYSTTEVLPPNGGGNKYRSVLGDITSGSGFAFGVYGRSLNDNSLYSGRAFGVYGEAGNASGGYNYGVTGALCGSNNGAGIFGASYGPAWGEEIEGRFAGYFSGKVYVSDTLSIGKKTAEYVLDVDGDACVA